MKRFGVLLQGSESLASLVRVPSGPCPLRAALASLVRAWLRMAGRMYACSARMCACAGVWEA